MSRKYRIGYDAVSNFWQLERDELRTSDDGVCSVKLKLLLS